MNRRKRAKTKQVNSLMIKVTDTATGEIKNIEGKLMVASNGMAFIKMNNRTVFATAALTYVFEEV